MAKKINSNKELDEYIQNIQKEADCHAPKVKEIIRPLSSYIRKEIDHKNNFIEVYEREGNIARACWITLNKRRLFFKYNYETQEIFMKNRSQQGNLITQFDNSDDDQSIKQKLSDYIGQN
jgi:hypothetical protein